MLDERWMVRSVMAGAVLGTGLISYAALMTWRIARASRRPPLIDDFLLQKNFPKAIEHLKLWLSGNPKDRRARFLLGVTLARAGRRDESMATMQELAAKNDSLGQGAKKVFGKMEVNPAWGISAAD